MTIHGTIAQLSNLEDLATRGEWSCEPNGRIWTQPLHKAATTFYPIYDENEDQAHADAHFVVTARNAMPSIIAYIRALEKVMGAAETFCASDWWHARKHSEELEKAIAAAAREAAK